MWIQTQDRQKIVNSDHIISIYIRASRTTVNIYADLAKDREATYVILGEYKDRDTCLKVLDGIILGLESMVSVYVMPLGGEVNGRS